MRSLDALSGARKHRFVPRENCIKNAKTRKRSGLTQAAERRTFALPQQGLRPTQREPTDRLRPVGRHRRQPKGGLQVRRGLGPGRPAGTAERPERHLERLRLRQDRCGRRPRGLPGNRTLTGLTPDHPRRRSRKAKPKRDRSHRKIASPPERSLGSTPEPSPGPRPGRHGQGGRPLSGGNRQEFRLRSGPSRPPPAGRASARSTGTGVAARAPR
jgi:hypothetical protein